MSGQITATNKATGEVIELPANTPKEIVAAWRTAQEYEKTSTALKDQLKKLVPQLINDKGVSEEVDGYIFRQSNVQRMTYDKIVLREQLDPDTFDVLIKPDKPAIDKFIKENLDSLGDKSIVLRNAMVAEGKPYSVTKLEKVLRS